MGDDVLKTLRDARVAIIRQLEFLGDRLKAVDAAINNVEPFYNKTAEPAFLNGPLGLFAPGITDAIRGVYSANADKFLSPTNVRDALKKDGLLKGYDNEMAVIHQVIRRLEDQGQLQPHPVDKLHKWVLRPQKTGTSEKPQRKDRFI